MVFATKLITWHHENPRPLPWKSDTDPYKIWLSEIILQQTRVAQGTPYFNKFVSLFPTVQDLAKADIDDVLKAWEGLGYYSRARNLHHAAQAIVKTFNGVFPSEYKDILSLKGVGPYTAAAISSFAFKLPYAVVDGNVIRVLSRYFGVVSPIDDSSTLKLLSEKAQLLLSEDQPDLYNQAIMDLGATICKPQNPLCASCPLGDDCAARIKELTSIIPYKAKKPIRKTRYFHYLVLINSQETYVEQRIENDIWKGLYQFPLIEKKNKTLLTDSEIIRFLEIHFQSEPSINNLRLEKFSQHLTHQTIHSNFYAITLSNPVKNKLTFIKTSISDLENYAFPKTIRSYIGDHLI